MLDCPGGSPRRPDRRHDDQAYAEIPDVESDQIAGINEPQIKMQEIVQRKNGFAERPDTCGLFVKNS